MYDFSFNLLYWNNLNGWNIRRKESVMLLIKYSNNIDKRLEYEKKLVAD